jgi:dipeptidyl aminopeptidase/acylaminoacyl peptidase
VCAAVNNRDAHSVSTGMRTPIKASVAVTVLVVLLLTLLVAGLVENALYIPAAMHPAPDPALADSVARSCFATWQAVEIAADDGAPLRAWIFRPRASTGSAVILLHGVADTRTGMMDQARFLLSAGYTVLLPDSRGHGVSGGRMITYGVLETGDLHRWTDWLARQPGIGRIYGLGASMGAAILLESLPQEPCFRAVVADCPFATFREVARDRLHQFTGVSTPLLVPLVDLGFVYARLAHGIDLSQASPAATIPAAGTPILLIHGDRDANIPVRHSRELAALNPAVQLWVVHGAGHVGSLAVASEEYARRVLVWFATHR